MTKHVTNFNEINRPRKEYQISTGQYTNSYRFHAPLFLRTQGNGEKPPSPEGVHPWLTEATKNLKFLHPNPCPPLVFSYDDGVLHDISGSTASKLSRGDVVWFTFTAGFVVGRTTWGPLFTPLEFVRVASANWDSLGDYSIPTIDTSYRPSLRAGEHLEGLWSLYRRYFHSDTRQA